MADFGLDLSPRTVGRAPKPVAATLGRELTAADLALLETERGVKPPALTRLRDTHHALARCLSLGMRPQEAAIVTGYSASRISILQADPAFAELVQFYRANADMAQADIQDRMVGMSLDVLQTLQRRLDEDEDSLSNGILLDMLKTLLDRTGHGPQTKSTNVNVNVDIAARMEAGRKRAEAARRLVIDESGEPVT